MYLMSNLVTSSIISPTGEYVGSLTIDIVPYNDNDMEFEDIPDNPMDLVGQYLNYRIYIKEAKNLPEHFCTNCFVEYKSFFSEDEEDSINRTNIVFMKFNVRLQEGT